MKIIKVLPRNIEHKGKEGLIMKKDGSGVIYDDSWLHPEVMEEPDYLDRVKKSNGNDLVKADNSHLSDKMQRFCYKPSTNYNVHYIPVNRLKQVYQTDQAINGGKVRENMAKMRQGIPLNPIEIGYNYDVHDGHHRWEAAKLLGHTHVPCIVRGIDPDKVREANQKYREVWKSEIFYIDLGGGNRE